jgi:hypothetical protein
MKANEEPRESDRNQFCDPIEKPAVTQTQPTGQGGDPPPVPPPSE